jgi:hypothetical protein
LSITLTLPELVMLLLPATDPLADYLSFRSHCYPLLFQ